MDLVGNNFDSSGLYAMYLDDGVLVTYTGSSESSLEETARQRLVPAPDFAADPAEWYVYGVEGHTCDVHVDGEHARIDGATYALRTE